MKLKGVLVGAGRLRCFFVQWCEASSLALGEFNQKFHWRNAAKRVFIGAVELIWI